VERIVTYLRDSGDAAIGDSVEFKGTSVSLPRRVGAEAIIAAIEAAPSYVVPTVRARADLRRLAALALALSKHGIDADAWTRENGALAQVLSDKRAALAADAPFEKAVADEGEIEIDRLDWAIGDEVPGDPTKRTVQVSPDSVERLFKGAKRVLGETAFAYWKARVEHDPELSNRARLEAAALSRRDDVIRALNEHSAARIDALFALHGPAINALTPGKRATYITIRGQAAEPTVTTIHLPDVGQFPVGREPETWPVHVFTDNPEGDVEMGFNTWETPTLSAALQVEGVVGWLRNVPRRDQGSLCVRWRDRNAWHPQFPDFLVVREVEEGRLVVDILDPHDHTRADSAKKAQGLAEYAQAHGHLLGHVDLLAKIGNNLRRLHLENEQTRQAVAAADTLDALRLLYAQAE
jgi:type III restriction enzyme